MKLLPLLLIFSGCSFTGGGGGNSDSSAPVGHMPDLIVDNINWSKDVNQLKVIVRIKNISSVNAPSGVVIKITDGYNVSKYETTSGVLLGGGIFYTFTYSFTIPAGATGETVTAIVDDGNTVAESNESNNTRQEVCSFPSPQKVAQ